MLRAIEGFEKGEVELLTAAMHVGEPVSENIDNSFYRDLINADKNENLLFTSVGPVQTARMFRAVRLFASKYKSNVVGRLMGKGDNGVSLYEITLLEN